jgi:UDP-glucose 4-epimerase
MAAATHKQTLEIWGDGSVIRDFVYIHDVAAAFMSACFYRGGSGIFNIGSGKGISISSLVKKIETACGSEISVNFLPERVVDVKSNVLNTSMAADILGWTPCVSLEKGLEKTALWWSTK